MAKILLIKPRKNKADLDSSTLTTENNQTNTNIEQSLIYGKMSVRGVLANQIIELKQILEQYDCQMSTVNESDEILIQHKNQMADMVKFHCVSLFTTALALSLHFPKSHFYIYEVSGIQEIEKKSFFSKKSKVSGYGKEISDESWTQFNTKITLSAAVANHLNQSGYAIDKRTDTLFLNEKELQQIREHLFSYQNTSTDKKAA